MHVLVLRRRLLALAMPVVLVVTALVLLPAQAARADFVSSLCRVRGPVNGDKVNVCVRVETFNNGGILAVRGYGALDHIEGTHSSSVRLRVEALHIRVYFPVNGPELDRIISNGAVGYGYINDRTEGNYLVQCGYGYKAVMTYGIRWSDGSLTRETNFYTPSGTTRWSGC